MPIAQEDVPRFAVAAVCRGMRKEEIIIDLTDAGVTQPSAQRLVEDMARIHQELRSEGPDGLEAKVLQAWLRQGTSVEFAPSSPRFTPPDYGGARALVWLLRTLTLPAACWGVWYIIVAVQAARAVSAATREIGPGDARESQMAQAVESAEGLAVLTAVMVAAGAVTAPLFLAEVLNLLLAIAANTGVRNRALESGVEPTASADAGRGPSS
jgi:hypothetical protein